MKAHRDDQGAGPSSPSLRRNTPVQYKRTAKSPCRARHFIISALALLASFSTPLWADALPARCQTSCVTPFGATLGKVNEVAAFSNCSAACFVPQPHKERGTYTGIEWQCVEYARRWLLVNKGAVFGDVDVAADLWNKIDHVTRVADNSELPLQGYINGSSEGPRRGDLLIYAREYLNTGHVAVVVAADLEKGIVKVGEQNFQNQAWPGEYARELTLVKRDGKYWLLEPYVLGWKRVP